MNRRRRKKAWGKWLEGKPITTLEMRGIADEFRFVARAISRTARRAEAASRSWKHLAGFLGAVTEPNATSP